MSVAKWGGKINQNLHCDWLPDLVRWRYLGRSGLPRVPEVKFPESDLINPLVVDSFFMFMDLDSISDNRCFEALKPSGS